MRLPKQWLSILSVNSIFLFNLGFPLLTLPTLLHRGEVIAQTDPNAEADQLLNNGDELFQQGTAESYKQAIVVWEKALQLYQQAGNLQGQANSLLGLGRISDLLGEKQTALDYYNQSLSLWRQVGDKGGEAVTLHNMGLVYSNLGDSQTALDYYNQSLPLSRQVGNKGGEAATLHNIGDVYSNLGDSQTALDFYNPSLPLWRQVGDKAMEATTLNKIGLVYNDLGDKQQALDYYNQSLSLLRQLGDKKREGIVLALIRDLGKNNSTDPNAEADRLYNQGLELYKQGTAESYEQAFVVLEKSLQLSQQAGNLEGQALSLLGLGTIYSVLGDKQTALDYYNQSLPLLRQVGNLRGEADILGSIGYVYNTLGDKQTALDYYNQSLSIWREVGDIAGAAVILNHIATVYSDLGDKQRALEYYNQPLPLGRQVEDKAGVAATLNNIGRVYDALGDKQTALDYYNQSLPLLRQVRHLRGEATTLNNIGYVYSNLGDSQTALDFYNQSLPLRREVGDKAGEAVTLTNIGRVYDTLEDKQTALDYYNQSLPLLQQVGDKTGEAVTLNNIGVVYNDLGDKQQALEYYNQSLLLRQQVGDKSGEAATLWNFAFLKRSQGNLTEALTDIESAINIIEELRTKIISQDLRTSYFSTVYHYYEFYIDLLMELHEQNPNQGYDTRALHASERGRARSLLDILAESGANIKEGVDPQLLAEEQKLLQRLNTLDQSRQLNPGERDIEELKQEIETVRRQLQNLEVEIKRNSPQYANLKYPEPLTAAEIQQQVLDDETVLLVYSLGRDRSFLWLVSSTEVKSYQLPKRDKIEQLSQSFLAEIESKAIVPSSGEALSQVLLSPVINQLGNKRLVIVGDGILQTVPFAALPITSPPALSYEERGQIVSSRLFINGEGGEKTNHASLLLGGTEGGYSEVRSQKLEVRSQDSSPVLGSQKTEGGYTPLIVQHEIITLPSASSLAILREQVQGRTPAPKKVAVIADPVFEENDTRFQGDYQASTRTNNVNLIALRQAISDDYFGKNFGRLDHTRDEAEAILALVPDDLERLALDFNATRQAATDSNLSQYQIVHFATHGLLNETQPELSGLVFSLYDQQGTEKPGFLQLSDIFNLSLSADLVVLSACETGVGSEIRGEGLVSLTRGFMYAGAERLVVSLWAVADGSTSELMQNYYRKILENSSNPATAMREAQLEMLQSQTRYAAPFFWAPFVFQGEWENIKSR